VIDGQPAGESLVRAAAAAIDRLADRIRSYLAALG